MVVGRHVGHDGLVIWPRRVDQIWAEKMVHVTRNIVVIIEHSWITSHETVHIIKS